MSLLCCFVRGSDEEQRLRRQRRHDARWKVRAWRGAGEEEGGLDCTGQKLARGRNQAGWQCRTKGTVATCSSDGDKSSTAAVRGGDYVGVAPVPGYDLEDVGDSASGGGQRLLEGRGLTS